MYPVHIQGYVVGQPEVKETPSGKTVIKFSISAPARFKKDGEGKKYYSFFECEYWPNDRIDGNIQREITKIIKGNLIAFHAEPIQDRWEQEDGGKRSKVHFQVDGFIDHLHRHGQQTSSAPADDNDRFEDDVPF